MASGRKDSEGIRLISFAYSDDDDDDDEEMEEDPGHQIDQFTAEEEDVGGTGSLMVGSQLQTEAKGDTKEDTPPEAVHSLIPHEAPMLSERSLTPESQNVNYDVNVSVSTKTEAVAVAVEIPKDVELLNKFLSSPPKVKCSDELQKKIKKFLDLKRLGKSYNAAVRSKKEYRNPDFLLRAVTYQDIDQIGSCFSKDVFDPHGYDKSDYYDEIEADMKREMERKEQERKKSPKVEFVSGGMQPAVAGLAAKLNLPVPGVSTLPAGGLLPVPVESVTRDGRTNKKSKWDKVDDDQKNILPSGRHGSVSAAGGHGALVSANAGAGYTAFAQQRRREVQERRSSEKERRS